MVFQDSTNLNNISKYIVDANGDTPYTTIQSAINAANTAALAAAVFVRAGAYTEDLTLYSTIDIVGDDDQTIIRGVHTPPNAGTLRISNITLTSPTDIFESAAAGTTEITLDTCQIDCDNGFTFDLDNWTGTLQIINTYDDSTLNGVVNNTGGCNVNIWHSLVGAGATVLVKTGGELAIFNTKVANPITTAGAAIVNAIMGSYFENTVTLGGTTTSEFTDCSFETGANVAIIHNSANETSLSKISIDTSNVNAIAGVGAGNLLIGDITFLDSSAIAGTLTVDRTPTLTTGVARTTTIEAIGSGAGAQNVIDITPAIAIGGVDWNGIYIDGTALDPTAINASANGIDIDLSGVAQTNDPDLHGANIVMPAAITGEGCDTGILVTGYGMTSMVACNQRMAGFFTDYPIKQQFDITAFTAVDTGLAYEINVDNTGSTGGDFHGLDMTVIGAGTSDVYAVGTNPEVGVIHQHTGVFAATAQSWKENGGFTDVTAAFDNPGVDVTIFDGDDDYIYIGSNAIFSQIRVILNTVAGRNIFATFEYSIGGPAWTVFTPTDGTNGFTQNGIISFTSGDLAGWASVVVNAANHFYIRIRRTRNNIVTIPIEDTIRILEPVEYYWNEDGEILISAITGVGANFTTVDAGTFDTNVAAAAVQLSGTTLSADGTDANIDVSVTPKGTGVLLTPRIGNAADITAIAITAAGEVTKPLQPAFSAYNSTTDINQTGNGAAATVEFDTEIFDQNADFDTGTDTFTAPVTGVYCFNISIRLAALTAAMTNCILRLVTTNRTYICSALNCGAVRDNNDQLLLNSSLYADMTATNTAYVTITIQNGAGDTASITGGSLETTFSGSLIC